MRNLLSDENAKLKSQLDEQIMENKKAARMYEELRKENETKVRHDLAEVYICVCVCKGFYTDILDNTIIVLNKLILYLKHYVYKTS